MTVWPQAGDHVVVSFRVNVMIAGQAGPLEQKLHAT